GSGCLQADSVGPWRCVGVLRLQASCAVTVTKIPYEAGFITRLASVNRNGAAFNLISKCCTGEHIHDGAAEPGTFALNGVFQLALTDSERNEAIYPLIRAGRT